MGFLDWFKGTAPNENWHQMQNISDLEKAIESSYENTVVIFKHSTRCGTSHHALQDLLEEYQIDDAEAEVYYLDLIRYREVSNCISDRLKIPHQSPQIIVLKNGEVVHNASHQAVKWEDVRKFSKV